MEFLATIKAQIPDYAKDIRLNLDGVIARSSLAPEDALGVALAAAFAAKAAASATPSESAGVRLERAIAPSRLRRMSLA